VQGKVKWFSAEKGYGFIAGDDGTERHFGVRDVKGADLPSNGDTVTFDHQDGRKGPRATGIAIVSRAPPKSSAHRDDRVTCAGCGRKMVPRIITDRGSLSHSVCPFCGATHKNFGWCFIATAVYGDVNAPQVIALRRYRDTTLRRSAAGRAFVALYYRASPPIARYISRSPTTARLAKAILDAFVGRCSRFDR
jgi:cold shock CspA family protein